MLRASMPTYDYGTGETEYYHSSATTSTIASSNGMRPQQGRIIRRQMPTTYKSIQTSRLAPRRRYFMSEQPQNTTTTTTSEESFPGPDYMKRMKENYENGKIIYIRKNGIGKNSAVPARLTSTITNSIRSTTYHTTTTSSAGKLTLDTSGGAPKYVFRLPKTETVNNTSKFDENRPNSNMYVPAYEPLKTQYTTVPACMSMGGEIVYEEEVDELNDGTQTNSDEVITLDDVEMKKEEEEDAYLKCSGPLVHHSSIGSISNSTTSSSSNSTPGYANNQSYKMLPIRSRLPPARFTCPQTDCYWRGPTDLALRKHMQVHGPKQPVMYSGATAKPCGDTMKVQMVQPKPKGVKCSECDTFAYSRPLLLRHMYDAHGIEAPLIRRTFANREMLQTWLDSLRETHAVEFVVSSGSKKWGRGLQVHYLTCSRSGDQKERPNKKYVRPPRPSIKCGRNCMAYLKIKQNPTVSELQIEGCLHHSGHEIDHTRMLLETNELQSIGSIVDAVNEGMDVMGNVELLRSYLGSSGRFRLVSDSGIAEQMPNWFEQYHRAMDEYSNDINMPSMYRGSGALTLPNSYGSNTYSSMKSPASSARRAITFTKQFNKDIKREHSVPIRFDNNQMQKRPQMYNQMINNFEDEMFDEKKVKVEIEDEDTLAAQDLLKDEYNEMKHEDIFDSPMISGEDNRMLEDDEILCGGEEASGVTSASIDGILSANLPHNFALGGIDDITTDFNCGMDDDEFDEVFTFKNFENHTF